MNLPRPRRVVLVPAGLLLAAALAWGMTLSAPAAPPPLIDRPAPTFTLPHVDDAAATLSPAQMRGRVWVLNVWASWCAPCRDEHPLLVALAREGSVPLVGLNFKDDPRSAQEWLRRLGDPYAATALDRDGRTGADYGVEGVPVSFVIDRQGVLRHRHVGPLTQAVWAGEMLPLIQALQR